MNILLGIPLDTQLAEYIAKKNSENGMVMYERKVGDKLIIGMAPTSIEEKFYALPELLLLADQIVLSTRNIDKLFGEVLIACTLLDKRIILTKDSDVSQMMKGIALPNSVMAEKEELIELITSHMPQVDLAAPVKVAIDRCFNVKGIGTVALGIVTKGTLKTHDTLLNDTGKKITVRSIQSQDVDVHEAHPGTRVGLALKGIESDEADKGDIFSITQIKRAKKVTLDFKASAFAGEKMEKGKQYWLTSGFSYVRVTVESIEGSVLKVDLEKPIQLEKGDRVLIARQNAPRIFAAGTVSGTE
ncbi:MAG TPA: EF-Tu/IF-2/RF-3 family GTPase [Candidatus Acidoferrales bacterium]|nr:EF-Tu/IF-2/RF-3 family GTPase [Candidatus Acidoferrales bacterium]